MFGIGGGELEGKKTPLGQLSRLWVDNRRKKRKREAGTTSHMFDTSGNDPSSWDATEQPNRLCKNNEAKHLEDPNSSMPIALAA
ncbi:hypothetical protein L1887_39262 [Cichorium endivia]|nr:hypothetical protein L1887_39262 [Cichorium endivia]